MKTILQLLVTVSISILISSNSIYAYTVEFGDATWVEARVASAEPEDIGIDAYSTFTIRGGTTGEPLDVYVRVDFVQQVNASTTDPINDEAVATSDLSLHLPYEFVDFDEEPFWGYELRIYSYDQAFMYRRHITMELENVGGAYLYPDTEYWYHIGSSSSVSPTRWGAPGYGMAYGWVGITEMWVNGYRVWKDTESLFAVDFGWADCSGDCEGDFDGDNDVDGSDLAVFLADF